MRRTSKTVPWTTLKGVVLVLVAMASSRALAEAPAAQVCDAELEAVRDARVVATGIIAADNARDIERVLRYYAADAILLPPGEKPVVGREAIRPRYEELFSRFDPQIDPRVDESCTTCGLAFVRGHNGGRLVSRQSGEARELDDAYLMVLRREAGGEWRISHLMWHRSSAPAPERPER